MGQNKKGPPMSYSLPQESVHTEYGISLVWHLLNSTLGVPEHRLLNPLQAWQVVESVGGFLSNFSSRMRT